MSVLLSMISRQLALSISKEFQVQSLHCPWWIPAIWGMACSGIGGLPSGSFQTKSCLFSSQVTHDRVRASFGTRLAYGTALHLPSPLQRQSLNGHAISSPLTDPIVRSPPMCLQ